MTKQVNCIMLVDDNEIDNLLTQRIIEMYNISLSTITAKQGMDALQKLEEYCNLNKILPEVILIDLQMPLMNGFELIEEIKKNDFYSKDKIKLIAISASLDDDHDLKKLRSMNISRIMRKPFDVEELHNLLEKN